MKNLVDEVVDIQSRRAILSRKRRAWREKYLSPVLWSPEDLAGAEAAGSEIPKHIKAVLQIVELSNEGKLTKEKYEELNAICNETEDDSSDDERLRYRGRVKADASIDSDIIKNVEPSDDNSSELDDNSESEQSNDELYDPDDAFQESDTDDSQENKDKAEKPDENEAQDYEEDDAQESDTDNEQGDKSENTEDTQQNRSNPQTNKSEDGETKPDRKGLTEEQLAELTSRTIFVGNVPISVKKSPLKKFFSKFGKIDCLRFRSLAPADPNMPKRVAGMKQDFHSLRTSINSYIRFATRESALNALIVNGMRYQEHHLRVNMADCKLVIDTKKGIFVGNLPFGHFLTTFEVLTKRHCCKLDNLNTTLRGHPYKLLRQKFKKQPRHFFLSNRVCGIEDDELWTIFEDYGNITSVRVVRDNKTGIGRGFGYVNFDSSDAVEIVLQAEQFVYKERPLRIKRINDNPAGQKKNRHQRNPLPKTGNSFHRSQNGYLPQNSSNGKGRKFPQNATKSQGDRQRNKPFQGSQSTEPNSKKRKFTNNKSEQQKNKMMRLVARVST